MKIAVLVKQTPDTAELPKVSADEVRSGDLKVTMVINPWDEYAAEEAVSLGERYNAKSVAITMGPTTAADALKHALAMGVTEAVLVDSTGVPVDAGATSALLAAAVKSQGEIDLVITGKQSVDAGTGSVYVGVACRLDFPLVSNVTKVKYISENTIVVERSLDGRIETVSVPLPAVISVGKEINDPRYPSFMGIRKANRAEIPVVPASELEAGNLAKKTVWTNVRKPESADAECVMIEGATAQEKAAHLVDALMGEKVI
ncbi:MAG: electron transfer flavoprotein subunit beta/FixA family protein [Caldilineaceae bacterium]